jgi:ABC-type multidrug transport system fused ATPase/permease subunit
MKKLNIYRTLLNGEGAITMICATFQQSVVAASTYFIIAAIRAATGGRYEESIHYAIAFATSLIVVFLPATMSIVWLQKWRLESFSRFVDAFIAANRGKTTWAHGREKKKYESWLTNESASVFETGTHILFDLYQILFSTLLNVAVIAYVIDPRIAKWYIGAGVALLLGNLAFRRRISQSAVTMQNSRRNLSDTLLTAWENIFVGNVGNLRIWKTQFSRRLHETKHDSVAYERTKNIISGLTVTVALLIITAGNGAYLLANKGSVTALAGLLVTLPRQLQIIQNTFAFFGCLLSWEGVRGQFRELEVILSLSAKEKDLTPYVSFNQISIWSRGHESKFKSLGETHDFVKNVTKGRFTLRGKNGAGKSTMLSAIAESTGDKSFMLPSEYVNLAFDKTDLTSHSDGNRMLSLFSDPGNFEDAKIILLDEWDANLDSANEARINSAIDKLAEDRIVIESRHRS